MLLQNKNTTERPLVASNENLNSLFPLEDCSPKEQPLTTLSADIVRGRNFIDQITDCQEMVRNYLITEFRS